MRIAERFYQSFELQVDRSAEGLPELGFMSDLQSFELQADKPVEPQLDSSAAPLPELGFISDLQSVRVQAPIVELQMMPSLSAMGSGPLPAIASPVAEPALAPPAPTLAPLTPLELAVHQLLEKQLQNLDDEATTPELGSELAITGEAYAADLAMAAEGYPAEPVAIASEPAKPAHQVPAAAKPVAVVAVAEPAPLPEAAPTSHVHLVVEDGAERVVLTVAVRGNEVSTFVRTNDDELTASLARNAATLDHALRARGLDLAGFTAQRDRSRHDHDHEADREEDA